jgi:hypothetical protein
MPRILKVTAKFVISMIVITFVCTVIWEEVVAKRLFDCPGWLEYLSPGDWVHHPVAVQQIVHHRSMSAPDTIKAGWSTTGLWYLWYSFAGVSLILSILMTSVSWRPRR